jgi:hypothetical protein
VPRVIQIMPDTGALPKPHRDRARRSTARFANNADDLRFLLDVLGLWPDQDAQEPPTVAPMPLDPCSTSDRRRSPIQRPMRTPIP